MPVAKEQLLPTAGHTMIRAHRSNVIWRWIVIGAALLLTASGIAIRASLWERNWLFRDVLQPILGMVIALSVVFVAKKLKLRSFLNKYPVTVARMLFLGGCICAYLYYRSSFWTPLISEPWLCALCFVPASILITNPLRGQRRGFYLYIAIYLVIITITLYCEAYAAAVIMTVAYFVTSVLSMHQKWWGKHVATNDLRFYIILLITLILSFVVLALFCGSDITGDLFRWALTGRSNYSGLHGYDAPARGILAGAEFFGRANVDITEPLYDEFPFYFARYGYMITQVIYAFGWLPAIFFVALLLLLIFGCIRIVRKNSYISLSLVICMATEIFLYVTKNIGYKIANVAYLPFVSANIVESALVWILVLTLVA